jgi:hypothetical protein
MNFWKMSQTRQRAWLAAVIWTLAGAGFLLTFFSSGGPEGYSTDSLRHLTGAAALGFGFGGYWLMLWLTRRKRGGPPLSDERDVRVQAQANQATLIVVLVGIYIFTIGLWIVFETEGQVPVGWMWFMAYGSGILAFVTSSVTTLILDARVGGHG